MYCAGDEDPYAHEVSVSSWETQRARGRRRDSSKTNGKHEWMDGWPKPGTVRLAINQGQAGRCTSSGVDRGCNPAQNRKT